MTPGKDCILMERQKDKPKASQSKIKKLLWPLAKACNKAIHNSLGLQYPLEHIAWFINK